MLSSINLCSACMQNCDTKNSQASRKRLCPCGRNNDVSVATTTTATTSTTSINTFITTTTAKVRVVSKTTTASTTTTTTTSSTTTSQSTTTTGQSLHKKELRYLMHAHYKYIIITLLNSTAAILKIVNFLVCYRTHPLTG